jgi:hypothetical protein
MSARECHRLNLFAESSTGAFAVDLWTPAFEPLEKEIRALSAAAWDGYINSRKSPRTQKAGPGFADPDYDLAIDWINARDAIASAQRRHDVPRKTGAFC